MKNKEKKIFEVIMTEKSQQLLASTKLQFREHTELKARYIPKINKLKPNKPEAMFIIFKTKKIKGKQKHLKESSGGGNILPKEE